MKQLTRFRLRRMINRQDFFSHVQSCCKILEFSSSCARIGSRVIFSRVLTSSQRYDIGTRCGHDAIISR